MTTVSNTSASSVDQTSVKPASDGWDDSKHSALADFFHRHCPKITNDVEAVGKDIKNGLHAVADMAHQAVGAGEDIVAQIKKDGGLKEAMKDAVHDIEQGKNPLKGVINQKHIEALKNDASKLKENIEQLAQDGKPFGEDILNAMIQAKNASGDIVDLVGVAGEILSGQLPPGTLQRVETDAKGIISDLSKAMQWNNTVKS
ncbi:hypothetical protein JQC92_03775 [Shewanella sp. 202IG2-18]|uniref:hypothetical protein n=1 Tax=Parashewanella hymeniacidonis TaxID=2807618 RepID=UPI00196185C3|nr:hypothetical protein [Parashewanella hymeniacidonis]MBM7071160.1 hypothetical protein [Parashewanella hymeniacidonis]